MIDKRKLYMVLVPAIAIILTLGSTVALWSITQQYGEDQYQMLSDLAGFVEERHPEDTQELLSIIKRVTLHGPEKNAARSSLLSVYGYTPRDLRYRYHHIVLLYMVAAVPLLLLIIGLLVILLRNGYSKRIQDLTTYLEKINQNKASILNTHKEDDFSLLEDEMYKTVTMLRQTREVAIRDRGNLADSLADISHQLKTPLSSITVMIQLLKEEPNSAYMDCIQKQVTHLRQLVEVLLTLARIDAGVIQLKKQEVNVYTMLQLSVEELEAALHKKHIQVSLPNHPRLSYTGDMDWSIEAFSNLLKNCIEHTPEGGSIRLDYRLNPLYLQIQLEDSGEGFTEKDLPHIFERFYRGEKAAEDCTGIGLALTRALIEQQNGIIDAVNRKGGGACFTIRFYCHGAVT